METYQGNSILWPFSRTTKEKTVEEETVMLIFSLIRLTKVRVCEIEMSLRYAKILLKCSLKSPFLSFCYSNWRIQCYSQSIFVIKS